MRVKGGIKVFAWYYIALMNKVHLPRLMLAGISGDCGKTLVSLGLAAAWRRRGKTVAPFKKGPDYIDPAWLGIAAGKPARNLDTWMMDSRVVLESFMRHAVSDGMNLIEANRGLYDGEDALGTHSSAELSKLLKVPVIVIIPTIKITRTVAALVLGLQSLDRNVALAGVILNRVATSRQEALIRSSIEESTGIPVLGAIRRITGELLASRHLGLVTPEEYRQSRGSIDRAADIIEESVDLEKLSLIAEKTEPIEEKKKSPDLSFAPTPGLKIGIFRSSAFTFYYPENLEEIDRYGAVKVPVDPVTDNGLPADLDALYIGGGFPETHASLLSANESFRRSVLQASQRGLPVWAECGGLIFLCRSVHWQDNRYPMAGIFPADIVLDRKPAGHGYEEVVVDRPNAFLPTGAVLRGHEFHYSRLESSGTIDTIFKVNRGIGTGRGRDGLVYKNVVASYLHLHALGSASWIEGLLCAADRFRQCRKTE
ncbi:MAG: cobyrinate a,c-diamide synthase [Acidobacteria bacterium]|nr:cobyrinate a,c-diamide synthase [Acidobacteriota bacterium]